MRSTCVVVVGFVVALSGCGGKSHVDQTRLGNEAGASGAFGTGSAGHAGEVGTGGVGAGGVGVGGIGAGGAGTGGQPAECASFVDAKPLSVPVLIRNDFQVPIHLGPRMDGCAETPLFSVQDGSGKAVDAPNPCRVPCDTLLAGDPIGGCLAICPVLEAITLEPGETITTSWAGLFGIEGDLPSECVPKRSDGLDFGTRCEHSRSIPSGSYSFKAEAGMGLDCLLNSPDGCNECEPGASGLCTVPNALVSGRKLSAQAVVDLDAGGQNAAVVLVFRE